MIKDKKNNSEKINLGLLKKLESQFSTNGDERLKIFLKFLFKKLKNFLLSINECFNISPYPQIISLFDKDLRN